MDSMIRMRCKAGAHALAVVLCCSQPLLAACTGKQHLVESSQSACRAACSRLAADGESCLEWSAATSSACVARYSAASLCCAVGDRPICAVASPVAVGAACICRSADQLGAYVVQGSACRTP